MSVLITSVAFVIKCPFCLQMLILLRFAFGRLNSVSVGFICFLMISENLMKSPLARVHARALFARLRALCLFLFLLLFLLLFLFL